MYPLENISNAEQNGIIVTSSASSDDQPAWKIHNGDYNDVFGGWRCALHADNTSAELYDGTDGAYTGTVQLASNTPYGEWIATQLPQTIFLHSIEVTGRTQRRNRGPSNFKIYGSNDGNNWDELFDITGATPEDGSSGTIYSGINSNNSYNHFAMVITKTVGPTIAHPAEGTSNHHSLCIAELKYIGKDNAKWDTPYGGPINAWNVSQVTNMNNLFRDKTVFNEDISDWDVSNVTDMRNMFRGTPFNQSLDVNNFGFESDLPANFGTFGGDHVIGPVSYWAYSSDGNIIVAREDSNVLKMIKISQDGIIASVADPIRHGSDNPLPTITSDLISEFYNPKQAGSHLLYTFTKGAGFDDITFGNNGWNVSSVTDMANMFRNNLSFNQPLNNWNVSSVMTTKEMFRIESSVGGVFNQPLNDWNLASATDISWMFVHQKAFNQSLNNWDVSKYTTLSHMFHGCDSFNQPLNNWDVSNITEMKNLFVNNKDFNQDISGWDVSKVTNMHDMFYGTESFNQPIGGWNVSSVSDMSLMFQNSLVFNQVLNWNVSSVTNMGAMFNGATSFNGDISGWDVSSVTDMKGMFCKAKLFNQPLNWNVSNVTTMQNMFYIAEVFNNGGNSSINNWNVSQVTAMASMFREARAFNQPIGNWNVSIVDRMDYMFATHCPFNQDIGNWNVSNVVLFNNMFHSAEEFNNGGESSINNWDMSSQQILEICLDMLKTLTKIFLVGMCQVHV